MINKLKVLWFGLIPLGWFIAWQIVKWVDAYPVDCIGDENMGVCMFLFITGVFGTIGLLIVSIGLAVYLQD